MLCYNEKSNSSGECETGSGNYAPQVILFTAQFISGMGGPLFYTLGISYMDDNIKKSKTPALISELVHLGLVNRNILKTQINQSRFLVLLENARTTDRLFPCVFQS